MAEYPAVGFAAFVNGLSEGAKSSIDILKGINELKQLRAQWEAADADPRLKGKDGGDGYFGSGGDYGSRGDMSDSGSSTGKGGAAGSGGGEGAISDQDLYSYLVNNLNATREEATLLTSGAANESNFRYDVKHDSGIGYGLWGHNGDRLDGDKGMRAFAGVTSGGGSSGATVPWEKQAEFALNELRSRPEGKRLHDGMSAKELTDAQMDFEQPDRSINGGNYAGRLATTQKLLVQPPLMRAMGTVPEDTSVRPWETEGKTPQGTPASAAVPMPAYEPETAPPQAIGAPKPPDEVQSSQYTAPRSTVVPASYAGSGPAIVGDSIAGGFHVAAGGNPRDIPNNPSNTTAPVVNGRGPMNTLAYLHSLPDNYFQGRQVIFSGGASNNPGEIAAAYPAAMDEFKRLGASGVHVVGVGMQPGYEGDRYHDLNQHNKTIQQIAEKGGARFTGGLPAVVHPATSYYGPVYQRLRQGQPQAAIGADQQPQYAGLIPDSTTGSSLYGGYA